MKPYKVKWCVEIDAENEVDAAQTAVQIMSKAENRKSVFEANKFEVTEIGTIDTTIVDLTGEDVVDFHNVENE